MTRLRIGYTCHDRFPSTDTNTQQIFWTLYEVARLGHTVDLRVRALAGGAGADAAIAAHYGAPDAALPPTLHISAARRPLGPRALDTAWFDLSAPHGFDARRHDLLWTRDPLALVAAVRTRLPVVFETFRPDFAVAPAFAPWRRSVLGRGMWKLGAFGLAGVVTHSRLAADAFLRAGVPAERCVTAHNGFAPVLMQPEMGKEAARRATGLPGDRPLLVYTGHVGPHKGTAALIDLAQALPEMRVVVVGVDEGSEERQWLAGRLATAGVDNVIAVPRVPLSGVAAYLYAADCLVIPPTAEPLRTYGRTVLPMKVFSYLAAGRPILAPRLPDIEEVLRDGETALLVEPGDSRACTAAVRRVIDDAGLAATLAAACRAAARRHTWAARAEAIVATFARWLPLRPG